MTRKTSAGTKVARRGRSRYNCECSHTEAWCSGLTCSPVKAEIAGSNPVASAGPYLESDCLIQRNTSPAVVAVKPRPFFVLPGSTGAPAGESAPLPLVCRSPGDGHVTDEPGQSLRARTGLVDRRQLGKPPLDLGLLRRVRLLVHAALRLHLIPPLYTGLESRGPSPWPRSGPERHRPKDSRVHKRLPLCASRGNLQHPPQPCGAPCRCSSPDLCRRRYSRHCAAHCPQHAQPSLNALWSSIGNLLPIAAPD